MNKKNSQKFIKRISDRYFWGQHPDAALRYLPVLDEIKKAKLKTAKILEIGSGSLGITPYLKKPVTGIDISFRGPKTLLLEKIKGTATEVPFKKNAWDVVISVDVLEHLPKDQREKAIYHMLRVCSKLAILVIPVGELSQLQDKTLNKHYLKVFNKKNQFLTEHVKFGLENPEEILVSIDRSLRNLKKRANTTSYPLLNLTVRQVIMKLWISKSKLSYYFYLKGLLPFVPLLRHANFGNCYRRIFVIKLSS